jgi:hypothetical protein
MALAVITAVPVKIPAPIPKAPPTQETALLVI